MKSKAETEVEQQSWSQVLATPSAAPQSTAEFGGSLPSAMVCPNCGSRLEGRKCKLFCLRPGCGYQVTCAEW